MIVVIDNYDSFTYNLVQLVGRFTRNILVKRNDALSVGELSALKPTGIIISPGPGRPENAGISVDVIRGLGTRVPILGVCLGHQAIGYAFGGTIAHASTLMHGKTSEVTHHSTALFAGISNPFTATRYHSLVVAREQLPPLLEITSETADGTIMGLRHREFPIEGVQFHPESILTPQGGRLVHNWLEVHQCL